MANLEHFGISAFIDSPSEGAEGFVYLTDKDQQGLIEYVKVEIFDNSSEKSARVAGRAALSGKDFTGLVSLAKGDGKLTLRDSRQGD